MSGTSGNCSTAYFDTSIWVGYMRIGDPNYGFANELINKMCKDEYCVYVSDLVLLETISLLRSKIPSKIKIAAESRTKVKRKIENKICQYLAVVETYQKEGKVVSKNPSMSAEDLHKASFDYLVNYFGSLGKHGTFYRYVGLNHWDIQHAMIANSLGAETFYTADSDFEALKKSQIFNPMEFVINTP